MGWNEGAFSEEQVILTVDGVFELPPEIVTMVRDKHKAEWLANNLKDNKQYGIRMIDPHRTSDEMDRQGYASHLLRIYGHAASYFDFLSTHRMLLPSAPVEERLFIENIVQQHSTHYLDPIVEFPNFLSVGLSLFCEKGSCLVLTHRSKLLSTGGGWAPGSIFNAVGETVTPMDLNPNSSHFEGKTRLSVWTTAKRGLYEEMGIRLQAGMGWSIVLHTLAWDNRTRDYNFSVM